MPQHPERTAPIAIVTGASGGVGLEVARQLDAAGWQVHAQYRREARTDEVPGAHWFRADFAQSGTLPIDVPSRLDALVLCAGVARLGRLDAATAADWQHALHLNLLAPVATTNQVLPALRAAGGHVVYLNSGAGIAAKAEWGTYCASKFAARAWTDTLRQEEPGIRVTSIHPGHIDTQMQRGIVSQEGEEYCPSAYLTAESVATAAVQALKSSADAHPTEVVLRPRPH